MKIIREGNKQSRLRHYIGAPKRFLCRAQNFYVDAMVSFDGKVSRANAFPCPAAHASHLPNTFGCRALDNNENHVKELFRSISDKYSWDSREPDKNLQGRTSVSEYRAMDRSYSVAVGRMGRIDEDEPCAFQESVVVKSEKVLITRSRSHAVASL